MDIFKIGKFGQRYFAEFGIVGDQDPLLGAVKHPPADIGLHLIGVRDPFLDTDPGAGDKGFVDIEFLKVFDGGHPHKGEGQGIQVPAAGDDMDVGSV